MMSRAKFFANKRFEQKKREKQTIVSLCIPDRSLDDEGKSSDFSKSTCTSGSSKNELPEVASRSRDPTKIQVKRRSRSRSRGPSERKRSNSMVSTRFLKAVNGGDGNAKTRSGSDFAAEEFKRQALGIKIRARSRSRGPVTRNTSEEAKNDEVKISQSLSHSRVAAECQKIEGNIVRAKAEDFERLTRDSVNQSSEIKAKRARSRKRGAVSCTRSEKKEKCDTLRRSRGRSKGAVERQKSGESSRFKKAIQDETDVAERRRARSRSRGANRRSHSVESSRFFKAVQEIDEDVPIRVIRTTHSTSNISEPKDELKRKTVLLKEAKSLKEQALRLEKEAQLTTKSPHDDNVSLLGCESLGSDSDSEDEDEDDSCEFREIKLRGSPGRIENKEALSSFLLGVDDGISSNQREDEKRQQRGCSIKSETAPYKKSKEGNDNAKARHKSRSSSAGNLKEIKKGHTTDHEESSPRRSSSVGNGNVYLSSITKTTPDSSSKKSFVAKGKFDVIGSPRSKSKCSECKSSPEKRHSSKSREKPKDEPNAAATIVDPPAPKQYSSKILKREKSSLGKYTNDEPNAAVTSATAGKDEQPLPKRRSSRILRKESSSKNSADPYRPQRAAGRLFGVSSGKFHSPFFNS